MTTNDIQWTWMMQYCIEQKIPCAQVWAWRQAREAYESQVTLEN